jgi:crotonobetainyl-CoA:carnitine CoA-transferase CaiB-like acyl-CoA transferase
LVAVSDVVLDNFSPVGRRKIGLDYSRLRQVNPRIIVAALSAAGQEGPWSDVLTYGPSLTALYGMKSLLGYAGESELQEDVADLDPIAATYATVAILASLRARERTGEGQFIDMAQGESGVATLAEPVLEYTMNGRVMGPMGNQHRMMAPHGIYPSAGDDAWVSIAVDSEAAWQSLCTVLHCTELCEDSRFVDMSVRLQHRGTRVSLLPSSSRQVSRATR